MPPELFLRKAVSKKAEKGTERRAGAAFPLAQGEKESCHGTSSHVPMSPVLGGSGDSQQETEVCSHPSAPGPKLSSTQSIKYPPQAIPSGQNSGW